MRRRPPRSPLFPYTTLFRSQLSSSRLGSCGFSNGSSGSTRSAAVPAQIASAGARDRKSTRLNSSHTVISYAVFCLKKKMALRLLLESWGHTVEEPEDGPDGL